MQYYSIDEAISYSNKMFTSKNVKEAFFKNLNIDEYDIDIHVLKRLIMFTVVTTYIKWINKHLFIYRKSHAQMKVFELFESVYKTKKMSFDIAVFVLVEIKKDILLNGKYSFFNGILRSKPTKKFSRLYNFIEDCEENIDIRHSDRFLTEYIELLRELEFLRNIDFKITRHHKDTIDIMIVTDEINLNGENYLCLNKQSKELLFLEERQILSSKVFEYKYISLYNLRKIEVLERIEL